MIVRNIPVESHRRLKALAERNGISVEEQVRRLIESVKNEDAPPSPSAGEILDRIRRENPARFEEGEIVELRGGIREVDFS